MTLLGKFQNSITAGRESAPGSHRTGWAHVSGRGPRLPRTAHRISSITPVETSRHSVGHPARDQCGERRRSRARTRAARASAREPRGRGRPARRPGSAARVGSPTLKTNAPRAGWESSPTTSHSTTYEPCCARVDRARQGRAPDDDRAASDLAPSGPVTEIPSPTGSAGSVSRTITTVRGAFVEPAPAAGLVRRAAGVRPRQPAAGAAKRTSAACSRDVSWRRFGRDGRRSELGSALA